MSETEQKSPEHTPKSNHVDQAAQFVNIISHDFSAPLRHARYFSDALFSSISDDLDESQQELADNVTHSLERMHNMLAALLQYSRLISQFKPGNAIPLQDLFSSVSRLCEPALEEAGISIDFPTDDFTLSGDRKQLTTMLVCLLENAVKFRRIDQPSDIRVDVEQARGNVMFRVTDNGIGIEKSYYDGITDIFRQLDPDIAGLGVGLALVERIVTNHKGRLSFSPHQPTGLCVEVTLPC